LAQEQQLHNRVAEAAWVRSITHAKACWPVLIALISAALPGCAAYRSCGFAGCAGDAQISAEVRALLKQHPALAPPDLIYVQTVDHIVYLSGRVDTELERLTAAGTAEQAAGVRRVVNSISLSYAGR
jgi:BON domain